MRTGRRYDPPDDPATCELERGVCALRAAHGRRHQRVPLRPLTASPWCRQVRARRRRHPPALPARRAPRRALRAATRSTSPPHGCGWVSSGARMPGTPRVAAGILSSLGGGAVAPAPPARPPRAPPRAAVAHRRRAPPLSAPLAAAGCPPERVCLARRGWLRVVGARRRCGSAGSTVHLLPARVHTRPCPHLSRAHRAGGRRSVTRWDLDLACTALALHGDTRRSGRTPCADSCDYCTVVRFF